MLIDFFQQRQILHTNSNCPCLCDSPMESQWLSRLCIPTKLLYMIKPMRVLQGYGPQNDRPLGLGQLYNTSSLWSIIFGLLHWLLLVILIFLNLKPTEQSISSVYAVPRLIMGLLAVLDTNYHIPDCPKKI